MSLNSSRAHSPQRMAEWDHLMQLARSRRGSGASFVNVNTGAPFFNPALSAAEQAVLLAQANEDKQQNLLDLIDIPNLMDSMLDSATEMPNEREEERAADERALELSLSRSAIEDELEHHASSSPSTDKRRVSFGGITGPSSPRLGSPMPSISHNYTPEPVAMASRLSRSTTPIPSPAPTSSLGEFDPVHGHHFQPVHTQLFHRPVPAPLPTPVNLDQIVAGLTPHDLESELPSGFPFVLRKPGHPATHVDPMVLPSAMAHSPSGKTLAQIRMEQLQAHQQFTRQVQQQQAQAQQHTMEQHLFSQSSPLSASALHTSMLRPSSSASFTTIAPFSPSHVHVHVTSPSARSRSHSRATSPFHASSSPSLIASVHSDRPHLHTRTRTEHDGGVEVDVWVDGRGQQQISQTSIGSARSTSPYALTPQQHRPYSIPIVRSDYSVASPAQSYASPPAPSVSFVHPSLSPPVPPHDGSVSRFAPSYPLRFPSDPLARSVHQTLYFPIPLGVPSAMLPLDETKVANTRLAAEIAHSALVASLAASQTRAADVQHAERARKLEHAQNVQRIQAAMQAQTLAHAQTIQPPNSHGRSVAHAQAAIAPMNHQHTGNSYYITQGTHSPLGGGLAAATLASLQNSLQYQQASPTFQQQSQMNSRIFCRPVTPAVGPALTPIYYSPVDFNHQQHLQQVALENISAHRSTLHRQDEEARGEAARLRLEEAQRRIVTKEAELRELRNTRAHLAIGERESHRRRSGGFSPTGGGGGGDQGSDHSAPSRHAYHSPSEARPALGPRHARAFASPSSPNRGRSPGRALGPGPGSPLRAGGTPGQPFSGSGTTPGKVALLNLRDLASPSPAVTRSKARAPPEGFSPTRAQPRSAGKAATPNTSRNLASSFA